MRDDNSPDSRHKRSTRAKSCTACRQAKSKCDLRTKYPSPCTRCAKSQQSCQTDASFQRVATRTRIKSLEAQVEQLHRSRMLEVPSRPAATGTTSEAWSDSAQQDSPDLATPVRDDEPNGNWYEPSSLQSPPNFILHDCMLAWEDVNELFLYFAQYHLPHCSFLIRISSLAELVEESELLLWTIILIAARHHRKHRVLNDTLETAHSRLRADKCSEAIRKLPDLQAVLLLCMWPLPVKSQDGDTAGLRLAEALSCARQMGLDMSENEILFGTRRAAHRLQKYPTPALRLTWLKCFELDVQLSLWHGILPALAASRYFRSVTDFCRSPDVSRSVAQTMDIYVRTARYLLLLDDTPSTEAAWNLARSFLQDLTFAKESKAATWSLENELVAETCQMYICMTSYVHIKRQRQSSPNDCEADSADAYAKEILLDAKTRAVNTIQRLCALTDEAMSEDQSSHAGTTTLPGHPKHTGRVMFFACCVLLQYLDSESAQTPTAQEKARNAFQEALQFFQRCPKATSHVLAGNTLEAAGRAIAHRRARLESRVTTRMGASVMHDVRSMSGLLCGRATDHEHASRISLRGDGERPASVINSAPAASKNELPDSGDLDNGQWIDWCYPGTEMLPFSMDLPAFEMWDDTLDGIWQNDFTDQSTGQWP